MTTFDGWEAQLYGPDTLAHFRTKGSKNGVRRYQNEDGTWTPLGLKERKAREGWGEQRRAARAERKAARQERRAANAAARKERMAAFKEKQRANNVKTMTDEELRKRIERAQLEKEYREISKSPVRQLGEKLIGSYFDYRDKRDQRKAEKEARVYEMMKMKEQTKQAEIRRDETKARAEADKATASANKARAETDKLDIEKGTRMKQLKLETKRANGTLTISGGLRRMINTRLTSRGERKANEKKGESFVNSLFANRARVDKYNKKLKSWQTKMEQDPHEWDRMVSSKNQDQKKKNK